MDNIVERLKCSVPEYIMLDITSAGYIRDENEIMYPLSNVVSIEWKLQELRIVEDNFDWCQIFVTTKDENNDYKYNLRGKHNELSIEI